ncbi:MAG: hypothetical protein ACYCS8_17680 [Acidithiobacillus sp.]
MDNPNLDSKAFEALDTPCNVLKTHPPFLKRQTKPLTLSYAYLRLRQRFVQSAKGFALLVRARGTLFAYPEKSRKAPSFRSGMDSATGLSRRNRFANPPQ